MKRDLKKKFRTSTNVSLFMDFMDKEETNNITYLFADTPTPATTVAAPPVR